MSEQQITTPEQLDALPVGSVVLDARGLAWQREEDGQQGHAYWRACDVSRGAYSYQLAHNGTAPLTVLHHPGAPRDSQAHTGWEYGFESPQPSLYYVTTNALLAKTMHLGRPDAPLFRRPAAPWRPCTAEEIR